MAIQGNYGRLATGIVFLALILSFELHVPAIQNLIPGPNAGLTSTNCLGFALLLGVPGALGGPSVPYRTTLRHPVSRGRTGPGVSILAPSPPP